MSAHTPGPWSFGHLGMEALWVGPDYDDLPVCTVPHDTDPEARDESRANAALIAAAPDLLAVLLEIVSSFESGEGGYYHDEIGKARRAIKKAYSESPVRTTTSQEAA